MDTKKIVWSSSAVLMLTAAGISAVNLFSASRVSPGADLPAAIVFPNVPPALNEAIAFIRNDLATRAVWGEPEVQMLLDYAARSGRNPNLTGRDIPESSTVEDVAEEVIASNAVFAVANRLLHGHKIDERAGPQCVKLLLDLITSPRPDRRHLASPMLTSETGLALVPGVRKRLLTLLSDSDPMVALNVTRQLENFDKRVAIGRSGPLPAQLERWTNEALAMGSVKP